MAPALDISKDEVSSIIQDIASDGKFWLEWDKLKNILSSRLKQVLSEYAEAKMTTEEQSASLGETFEELEGRLDEALLSFEEGPPFTLQRLCEIISSPKVIYPKLSKLALALEKNLLVTSMLTNISPRQTTLQESDAPSEVVQDGRCPSSSEQDGVDIVMEDRDETTTAEIEESHIDEGTSNDAEAPTNITETPESSPSPSGHP
ncbi:hypothetical protein MLD38_030323 [Melastoma candidum]|uniref:Uncharacterized protein n=1 Tax=Melastoma candidum TaxID=119954 RepID=A0ACB9ML96_9MYRT|nr:hypothetical protein MLD38_030323 [Melastoma candidum]